MAYLHYQFSSSFDFEIHGFDVSDSGVQKEFFFVDTIGFLKKVDDNVNWDSRISLLKTCDDWPYPDGFFDVIISNQVLEHVSDHRQFFRNLYRSLQCGGFSVHLFPLQECLYEGHLHLPLVHKLKNYSSLLGFIRFLSSIGLGKFRRHHSLNSTSLDVWSERHADYIWYFTNYLSYNDVLTLGKLSGLRTSYKYTRDFYTLKFKSFFVDVTKMPFTYNINSSVIADHISIIFLRYFSSITVFLEKKQTYRNQ
jgi:SAM-dependent methyltransferase